MVVPSLFMRRVYLRAVVVVDGGGGGGSGVVVVEVTFVLIVIKFHEGERKTSSL